MKASEYIPTTLILLTGLLCLSKLIGMFPLAWIWAFVLIWGPILVFLSFAGVFVVLVMAWLALSEIVAVFTGENSW